MQIPRRRRALAAALLTLALGACDGEEAGDEPAPAPQVSVLTLVPAALVVSEDWPARVAALRSAEIRPQVGGIVQQRLFEQGAEIRQGQALYQINPAPFQAEVDMAEAALQRAQSAWTRARTQEARLEPLMRADAVSRQAYDDAFAQREQAEAELAQARAALARRRLDLRFATVEAPISGRVEQALVSEGALVSPTDTAPMARIQQIGQVYVDVRQPAAALPALRAVARTGRGAPAPMVPLLRSDGEPLGLQGRMLFSGISVDAGTGELLLRLLVDNPQRQLLPGLFVLARVPQAAYAQAITVPQQAVQRVAGLTRVWVLDAQQRAQAVSVQLGERVGQRYRIVAGLQAGQQVVVEGGERLSEGVQVVARDWRAPEVAPAAAPASSSSSSAPSTAASSR